MKVGAPDMVATWLKGVALCGRMEGLEVVRFARFESLLRGGCACCACSCRRASGDQLSLEQLNVNQVQNERSRSLQQLGIVA